MRVPRIRLGSAFSFARSPAQRAGPVREIRAGSGYWSMDGATTVIARVSGLDSIWVRWPGGKSTTVPVAATQSELTIREPR